MSNLQQRNACVLCDMVSFFVHDMSAQWFNPAQVSTHNGWVSVSLFHVPSALATHPKAMHAPQVEAGAVGAD